MPAYADVLRSTGGVSMNDAANLIEGVLPSRGALFDTTGRSQTGASTWVLVANTGVTVVVPSYAYVRQTATITLSHATNFSSIYVVGAQGSAAVLGSYATLCTVLRSNTGGADYCLTFQNIWKPGAGTFTYHICWLGSDAAARYTLYTTNSIEVIREATP
jgi:hypothetical protein